MPSLFGPLAAGLAAAFVVGGVVSVVGCAMSGPADLTPAVDPNLPELDASYEPMPAPGGGTGTSSDAGGSTGQTTGDSGGPQSITPDSGTDTGAPVVVPKPAPGEVLITEVMYDSFGAEPASEWIEVFNTTSGERMLTGLTIKDGASRTHVIGAGVKIAPGAYGLLVRSKSGAATAKIPSAAILYEYGTGLPDNAGVLLANGATGSVALLNGPVAISSSQYGGWFSQSGGSSVQLKVLTNGQGAIDSSWCLSLNAWATGSDKGTPGAAEDCP